MALGVGLLSSDVSKLSQLYVCHCVSQMDCHSVHDVHSTVFLRIDSWLTTTLYYISSPDFL